MKKIDDLTFNALYGLLQGGMWLLNDLENYLKSYRLSQGRLAILLQIQAETGGEVNPADVARITGKSRPTISRMIERLAADGLITANEDEADSRRKILTLTSTGETTLDSVIPGYNERLNRIGGNLDDSDKRELLRILGKVDFLDPQKTIGPVS